MDSIDEPITGKGVGAFMIAVVLIFVAYSFGAGVERDKMTKEGEANGMSAAKSDVVEEGCNVAGINLHGELITYLPPEVMIDGVVAMDIVASEDVVYAIQQAGRDEAIGGILIEIDSPGGLPVASEEIADALRRVSKPTVAVIRNSGASAAYWVATGADRIFASKNSNIGSIGVTMSYLDETEKNRQEGLSYVDLSTGKFKDVGVPGRPITAEERALLMRDVKIIYENFVEVIATNRNIPIESVRAIADGSTVLGERALELKLIDEIGGLFEAEQYLAQQTGARSVVCWY